MLGCRDVSTSSRGRSWAALRSPYRVTRATAVQRYDILAATAGPGIRDNDRERFFANEGSVLESRLIRPIDELFGYRCSACVPLLVAAGRCESVPSLYCKRPRDAPRSE